MQPLVTGSCKVLCLHSGLGKFMSRLCMWYTDIFPFTFVWNNKINFLVFNTGKTEFLQLSASFGTFCFNVLVAGVIMCLDTEALQPAPGCSKGRSPEVPSRLLQWDRTSGELEMSKLGHRHHNSVLQTARQHCTVWEQAVTVGMSACCRTPVVGLFVKDTQASAGWAFSSFFSQLPLVLTGH